jgi:hypothetical protein
MYENLKLGIMLIASIEVVQMSYLNVSRYFSTTLLKSWTPEGMLANLNL